MDALLEFSSPSSGNPLDVAGADGLQPMAAAEALLNSNSSSGCSSSGSSTTASIASHLPSSSRSVSSGSEGSGSGEWDLAAAAAGGLPGILDLDELDELRADSGMGEMRSRQDSAEQREQLAELGGGGGSAPRPGPGLANGALSALLEFACYTLQADCCEFWSAAAETEGGHVVLEKRPSKSFTAAGTVAVHLSICRATLAPRIAEAAACTREPVLFGGSAEQNAALLRACVSFRSVIGIPCPLPFAGTPFLPPSGASPICGVLVVYSRQQLASLHQLAGLKALGTTAASVAEMVSVVEAERRSAERRGAPRGAYALHLSGEMPTDLTSMLLPIAAHALQVDAAEYWVGDAPSQMTRRLTYVSSQLRELLSGPLAAPAADALGLTDFSMQMCRASLFATTLLWCNATNGTLERVSLPMTTAIGIPVRSHRDGSGTAVFVLYSIHPLQQTPAATLLLTHLQALARGVDAAGAPAAPSQSYLPHPQPTLPEFPPSYSHVGGLADFKPTSTLPAEMKSGRPVPGQNAAGRAAGGAPAPLRQSASAPPAPFAPNLPPSTSYPPHLLHPQHSSQPSNASNITRPFHPTHPSHLHPSLSASLGSSALAHVKHVGSHGLYHNPSQQQLLMQSARLGAAAAAGPPGAEAGAAQPQHGTRQPRPCASQGVGSSGGARGEQQRQDRRGHPAAAGGGGNGGSDGTQTDFGFLTDEDLVRIGCVSASPAGVSGTKALGFNDETDVVMSTEQVLSLIEEPLGETSHWGAVKTEPKMEAHMPFAPDFSPLNESLSWPTKMKKSGSKMRASFEYSPPSSAPRDPAYTAAGAPAPATAHSGAAADSTAEMDELEALPLHRSGATEDLEGFSFAEMLNEADDGGDHGPLFGCLQTFLEEDC